MWLLISTFEVSYQALLLKSRMFIGKQAGNYRVHLRGKGQYDFIFLVPMLASPPILSPISHCFGPLVTEPKCRTFSHTREINSNQPNILLKC